MKARGKLRLPVTDAGEPDWEYMESVMRGLPFSAAVASRIPDSRVEVG
jgi:predicted SAM-dependent methyltransferase